MGWSKSKHNLFIFFNTNDLIGVCHRWRSDGESRKIGRYECSVCFILNLSCTNFITTLHAIFIVFVGVAPVFRYLPNGTTNSILDGGTE